MITDKNPHGCERTQADAHPHTHNITAQMVNVLIACEESGAECEAFRELGFNAYSCDLKAARIGSSIKWHIVEDVRPFLQGKHRFYTQDQNASPTPFTRSLRSLVAIASPKGSFTFKIPRRPPQLRCDAPSLIVPTGFLHLQDSATGTTTSL